MASNAKEKFDAAVKVIQGLPKDGPFQPSYEMMLSFYGHYKQATEGPCTKSKPWSWDIINKKKWDAWNKLGDMPREEAMLIYVEELKRTIKLYTEKGKEMKDKGDPRIVEAMPQSEEVRGFMQRLDNFYETVDELSPVEEARKAQEREINGTDSVPNVNDVSEYETTFEAGGTGKDHSVIVNDLLQKQQQLEVMINGLSEELDKDEEEDSEAQNTNQDVEEKEAVVVSTNGHQRDVNENHLLLEGKESKSSHADRVSGLRLMNGDRATSDTDSEDEFCDTSDQPSQEEGELSSSPTASTPYKHQNGKPVNHVHFSATNSLRMDADIHQGVMSPVKAPPREISAPLISHLGISGRHNLGDSLVVNMSQRELNLSHERDTVNKKMVTLNLSNPSNPSVHLSGSIESGKRYGGGDMSPPGGTSRGQRSYNQSGHSGRQGIRQSQWKQGDGQPSQSSSSGSGGEGSPSPPPSLSMEGNINEHIAIVLVRLQQDMNDVLHRLNALEGRMQDSRREGKQGRNDKVSRWWPFTNMTGRNVFFMLVWPVIVHWILIKLFQRRRNHRS